MEPEKKEEENIHINEEIKEEIKDKENILIVKNIYIDITGEDDKVIYKCKINSNLIMLKFKHLM